MEAKSRLTADQVLDVTTWTILVQVIHALMEKQVLVPDDLLPGFDRTLGQLKEFDHGGAAAAMLQPLRDSLIKPDQGTQKDRK